MKNIKNILQYGIIIIFLGMIIYLFLKINNINKTISSLQGEQTNLINITPSENNVNNIELFQDELKNNLNSIHDKIAAIYATQNIGSVILNDSGEENKIKTVEKLQGNAFIVSNDGYLITNKHVVSDINNTKYNIVLNGKRYPIDKVRFDDLLDIAILKIKNKESINPVKIVKINKQGEIGDIVFAIKNDPEIGEFLTQIGLINSKNQKFETQNNDNVYVGLIKNSTSIENGYSGSPLINIKGEVLGINTAVDNIEYSASYALPISEEFIEQTLQSIKSYGKIIRPDLGIQYGNNNGYPTITEIKEGSTAYDTELEIGDTIVGINDNSITYNNFLYYLYTYTLGSQITLNIDNNGHKKNIQIKIGKN